MAKNDILHGAWSNPTWTVLYGWSISLKIFQLTQWQWWFVPMMHQFQICHFPSKISMNMHMIMWWIFMQCDEWFGKFMSWEEFGKKEHSIWSYESKVMAFWSSMHTWQWLDHISLTIHQMLMILDFLEMGERDIQLSCWTKIHLKLLWWCKIKLNLNQNLSISDHQNGLPFWLQILLGSS